MADNIAQPISNNLRVREAGPGVLFCESFANVAAFDTAEGVLLVDTGTILTADQVVGAVRSWSDRPVRCVVLTHGHLDHVMGVRAFDEAAAARGEAAPEVVAHAAIVERFEVYARTAGYNGLINHRQFGIPPAWPTEFRMPDRLYRDTLELELGGERFELHHSRGETDDQTWVWIPGRGIVCCGDLYIGVAPNAGNPQKRQRFAFEWAEALDQIVALEPDLVLPGHGQPLEGAEIKRVLGETARWLRHLHDETVRLMNEGRPLDEIVAMVRPPADLADRPHLREVYDEADFVVRNIWRRYGGWWDGDPARLKPPPAADLAREVVQLAGGIEPLLERALALTAAGNPRLAAPLVEWAVAAAPASGEARRVRTVVYEALAAGAASVMSRGIYAWTARES